MAGDDALSARLRVAPLRSRHDNRHSLRNESKTSDGSREESWRPGNRIERTLASKSPRLDRPNTGEPMNLRPSRVADSWRSGKPVGHSSTTQWIIVPALDPLAPRGPKPLSAAHPKVGDSLRFDPGRRCALRYRAHHAERIFPGQGMFSNSQGCPRNFRVTHRFVSFVHRSCTAIPTAVSRPGRSGGRRGI
jgi:hypothetical protein